MTDEECRQAVCERAAAYKARRRNGRMLVPIEVGPSQLAALERLALLNAGERDKPVVAQAVQRFLAAAPQICALGDVLWPAGDAAA